jgi:hypothetical protein
MMEKDMKYHISYHYIIHINFCPHTDRVDFRIIIDVRGVHFQVSCKKKIIVINPQFAIRSMASEKK